MHSGREPEGNQARPVGPARARAPLLSTPFFAFGRKPFREARLASYVVRQHRRGRPLTEILADPYLARFGADGRRLLVDPWLIEALKRDALAAIKREIDAVDGRAVKTSVGDSRTSRSQPSGVSIIRMIEALRG